MSAAIEELLNIVWCLGADVNASILTDSALVGAKCICRTWNRLDISRFMRSSTSQSAGLHDWLAKNTVIGPPLLGAGWVNTICTGFAIPLCLLESCHYSHHHHCFTKPVASLCPHIVLSLNFIKSLKVQR